MICATAAQVRDQIAMVRRYVHGLIDDLSPDEWFIMPPGGITHVAWQIGHLATAQHWLALHRIRGEKPEDALLVPPTFRTLFGRLTAPSPDRSIYPEPTVLRAVLDKVYAQVMLELPTYTEEQLDAPVEQPHRIFKIKREALQWCPFHEMTHAGQIGLVRRFLGKPPQW